jgi:nicotinate phosphoribosyltransferase
MDAQTKTLTPRSTGLATDLYQLTMAAAYHAHRRDEVATFELFVRRLPPGRSYLVAAGLEQALEYLSALRFTGEDVEYLRALPVFKHVAADFFDYLRGLRFTGEIWAMPEGTLAFENEPLLRVTAPIIEAQLLETYLLSTVNFQTLIASKAARMVEAAEGRGVVEFGTRRAHGMEAGLFAARAAFIGGSVGTSNVEAGWRFGIPVYGTAAHSWVMSFEHERDAFRAFHQVFPEHTTLLLDTYDTLGGARLATEIGPSLGGVRLDSGDMTALSKQVREILDRAGMQRTKIMASGDLNEFKIAEMLAAGAQVDLFGVGTELATSRDQPALGGVYKLVELRKGDRVEPKMKLSQEKATYPHAKQVWRVEAGGEFVGDTIGVAEEQLEGEPLLECVMRGGEVVAPQPSLRESQQRAHHQLQRLSAPYRLLAQAERYPVRASAELETRRRQLLDELARQHCKV